MDFVVEDYFLNIVLIAFLMNFLKEYGENRKLKDSLVYVENKIPLELEGLLKLILLPNKEKKFSLKQQENPFNSKEIIIKNVILNGFISKHSEILNSKLSKEKTPLILKLYFKSPYSLKNGETLKKDWEFVNNNENSKKMVSFNLETGNKSIHAKKIPKCLVYQNPDAEWFFLEEDKHFSKKIPSKKLTEVGLLKKFFYMISSFCGFNLGFISLGIEEKEFGLKLGGRLGILGDVIYNSKANSLRIEKPLFLFRDRRILMTYLNEKLGISNKKLFFLGLCFISLSLLKFYMMFTNSDENKNTKSMIPGNEIYTNMDENLHCPNCKTRIKNVMLMPCRHLSFCEDCYYLLKDKKESVCPCCKQKFDSFYKIYIV